MKPAPFEYHAPEIVEEALALMAEHGSDAKPLAGGQSLIPAMNFRLARPSVLVDLNAIEELAFMHSAEEPPEASPAAETEATSEKDPFAGGVRIGAMTRQRDVERSALIARRAPLLAETLPHVAHPQIRNRGTFGGNIAHADPASELPAALLALRARCRLRGPKSDRWVSADEFFGGLFGTVLEPEELLVEVEIPAPEPLSGWAFHEIARRRGDYAIVGVAAGLVLDRQGVCTDARLAFLSVTGAPAAAPEAADLLIGETPTSEALRAAADHAASKEIGVAEDMHASEAYRRHLVGVLARQTLSSALERARAPLEPDSR